MCIRDLEKLNLIWWFDFILVSRQFLLQPQLAQKYKSIQKCHKNNHLPYFAKARPESLKHPTHCRNDHCIMLSHILILWLMLSHILILWLMLSHLGNILLAILRYFIKIYGLCYFFTDQMLHH